MLARDLKEVGWGWKKLKIGLLNQNWLKAGRDLLPGAAHWVSENLPNRFNFRWMKICYFVKFVSIVTFCICGSGQCPFLC